MLLMSWQDKKNTVCGLIKEISDYFEGDDIDELRDYCRVIIVSYKDDLDCVLNCFKDIYFLCGIKSKRN